MMRLFSIRSWATICGLLLAAGLMASPSVDLSLGAPIDDATGTDWTLPDGGLINLRIVDQRFHLLFLDEDRNLIEPAYERIILRGEETKNKTNEIFLPLRRGDGPFLTHPRLQYLPVDYWLRLVIPSEETEEDEAVVLPRERFRQ